MNGAHGQLLAGRYRLHEMVGSGGAGTVWAAVDEVLGREVAVKDVGGPRWIDMEGQHAVRERTLREARAAALIDHPNVVTVYDVVEVDGRPWIVMELIRARTLAQVIEEDGPRTPEEAARIGLQLLGALRAAHALGILHRDVKPSNVLVTVDERAVLTDFGIATIDGDLALTASGVLVGAPAFIAPERVQANAGAPIGPASDLWSLGATLYTAVEGRPPYQRDGAICTIAAVVHDEPDPVERAGHLAPVLAALLRRDPELRPAAPDLRDLLAHVVDREQREAASAAEQHATAPVATTVIRPLREVAARSPAHAVALLSAAGLLLTLLVVGVFAELTGGIDGGPAGPADQKPGVDAPASPENAGEGGGDGGPATSDSVAPAAGVSSVGPQQSSSAPGQVPVTTTTDADTPQPTAPAPTTVEPTPDPTTTDPPPTSDPATTEGSTTAPATAR